MISKPLQVAEGNIRNQDWHHRSVEEVLAEVSSSQDGLSAQEAANRLSQVGPNILTESRPTNPLQYFLNQFKSLIIWILIVAGGISGILGEALDAISIFSIVLLNAVIGFYQEFKAAKSITALKKMASPHARVQRDGQILSIPTSGVVIGDLLLLEAGDLVAADARLLDTASLQCIESALTGESEAVTKHSATLAAGDISLGDRANMVFMGTGVVAGSGHAVVVATAMKSELGKIAVLLDRAGEKEVTPLQRKLDSFGQILVWITLGIVVLLFVLGWLRGIKPFELFMTSVSLAVAAVPEGLPAVVTLALSLGVTRMARRRALMRRLAAVETLGSTSIICTDKTGTLTVGEMTVRALFVAEQTYDVTGEGYAPEGDVRFDGQTAESSHAEPLHVLATVLICCNNAHLVQKEGVWQTLGDPTEGALLVAGIKAGGDRERINREMPRQKEFPFDSDRKRSSVICQTSEGKNVAFVNGAPGILLQQCTHLYTPTGIRPLTAEDRENLLAQTRAMAKRSLRVLGSAYRDLKDLPPTEFTMETVEHDLVFVGLTGMYDPPRPAVQDAVVRCHTAGIRVVMITGDHPETAAAIAREIEIASADEKAITGVELDRMSEEELKRRALEATIYSRVTAAHKLRIVQALRASGAVVAMTGDGVNDAPAIKGADIGIAMGRSGAEVTRQAADMIITDDDFTTIVAAVEEGRGIYDNIRKTLQYLLAGNASELLLMMVSVIVGLPPPLLPIHLLWINLVTDGLPALCLAADPIDTDVMNRPPRPPSAKITDQSFLRTMVLTGVLTAGIAFATFVIVLQMGTVEMARTYAFTVLVFAELLRSFGVRSETKPFWKIPFLTNPYLVVVVTVSLVIQAFGPHNANIAQFLKSTPMPINHSLLLFAAGSVPLFLLGIVKAFQYGRTNSPAK